LVSNSLLAFDSLIESSEQDHNMLDPDLLELLPDKIAIHKSDGKVLANLAAQVSSKGIMVADGSVIIEFGDMAERIASNGLRDYFEIDDPGFVEDTAGLGTHYQMKVHRISGSDFQKRRTPAPSTPTTGSRDGGTGEPTNGTKWVPYDVFICHASEDKEELARPLYRSLSAAGVSVWFDEAVLELGDSLRQKIDEGLARCRFGVVLLSPNFFAKKWPQMELDALLARETASGEKAILPIWHKVDQVAVQKFAGTLVGRLAARSDEGMPSLIDKILRVVKMTGNAGPY
jgi:hypothetical protein